MNLHEVSILFSYFSGCGTSKSLKICQPFVWCFIFYQNYGSQISNLAEGFSLNNAVIF